MGIGRLVGGKFNLVLSVRHNADAATLNQWRASWEQASHLLFDATDAQHQFGDIYICNNSSGGRNADAWLFKEAGTSFGPGFHVIGSETLHMTIFGDERFKPFVLVHEFGHYAYGCGDEYKGPNQGNKVVCIGGTTANACIMEAAWTDGDRFGGNGAGGALTRGRVRAFCVASNHDPDHDTDQQDLNHMSCWETLVANFPSLALPAGLPAGAGARVADPINWVVLAPEQRYVLVLDRSGSMEGDKIAETRLGTDWWADNAVVGDHLGVVSFASDARADFPMRTITSPADRAAAHTAIDAITAGGVTSIGGGLRLALNQILGQGPRAATQVAVLVTDGVQNSGENASAVVPDLVANGVRVYTIGVGPDIDAPLLQNIATMTGGVFYRIDPKDPAGVQATRIRDKLQEISGIGRDNGGVVTTIAERPDDKPYRRQHTIFIEPGSELATFAVSWPGLEDLIELELVAPDGTRIARGSGVQGVRDIFSDRPYMGFQVEQPEPGDWTLLLTPERISNPDPFRLFVFSQNPAIDGGLASPRSRYRPGACIPLNLQVYFEQPLTDLQVTGVAHLPSGEQVPLVFVDDGDSAHGDVRARDGIYSALFTTTKLPGMYRFDVDVESDGSSVRYAEPDELPLEGECYEPPPIPPFRRRFGLTIAVGVEGFERSADPDHTGDYEAS